MELTIYQILAILNTVQGKDKKFKRVNDENFKIFRNEYGELMYEIDGSKRNLQIFNYMQDRWILEDKQ
ncbi:hypothetical protein [Clostridium sp. ZBS18]|uniref:hypothetical protein n=1 Tax=Clostridium sp. ZBS18 TaxID=2949967 RepID=UPI00207A1940|nr:hypothetical protein [Clostridium sp. ZBS18]